MKKRNLLLFVSAATVLLFSSFMVLYPSGAPSPYYYTGSPGDGHSCSSCHGNASTVSGWITSTIPAAGYVPGTVYQVTATNTISGSGKYGFEVSPQTTSGTLLGTLASGTNSKLVGSGKWVTHSTSSNSIKSWTFSWTAPAAGTGNVTFYGSFARSTGSAVKLSTLTVNEQSGGSLPGAAGPIAGATSVCRNSTGTNSVAPISGATAYVWSVPTGASIISGQGTTAISVNYSASAVSGNVTVYGTNGSGSGAPSSLGITVNSVPSQPGAITGSSSPCQGSSQTYSVTNTSGVIYTWTVPTGSVITAGQGTNSITVTIGSNFGIINVTPSNTCGDGTFQVKTILISLLPGMAGVVAGLDQVDLATISSSDYTTPAATDATSYQWELSPDDAGTINGSGLTGTVSWNGSFLGAAQIRVKAINSCGEGAWSEIKSTLVINTTGIVEGGTERGMKIYPSPNHGSFTVALNGISGQAKFSLLDTTGHELYSAALPGDEATPLEYHLSPGIYLVLVEEGTQTLRQKLVVQ